MVGVQGLTGRRKCEWSMGEHLQPARDHDIALPQTGTCQEPRAANIHVHPQTASCFSTNSPKVIFCFCCRSLICLLSDIRFGMLLRPQWPCRRLHHNARSLASITARSFASSTPRRNHLATSKTRNIGIIAHIDAVCRDVYSFNM